MKNKIVLIRRLALAICILSGGTYAFMYVFMSQSEHEVAFDTKYVTIASIFELAYALLFALSFIKSSMKRYEKRLLNTVLLLGIILLIDRWALQSLHSGTRQLF